VIARFAKRVVLAFDADSAGQSAASRFYEWERRDDVQVSVAALPPGSDPGELARTNPEQLRAAVEGVMPFLGFRVDRALTSGDLRAPEGRAKAAEAAVAMIAEHPDNALIRDQYLVTIADKTRIDVERLRELVDRIARENRGDRPAPGVSQRHRAFDRDDEPIADNWEASDDWEASATGSRSGTGSRSNNGNTTTTIRSGSANRTPGQRAAHDALILAVHEPEAMAAKLDEVLFADPTQKAAYLALAGSPNLHEAIEGASDDAAQLLRELAVSEPEANADQTIVALVRASAVRVLRDLESDARNAEAAGNAAGLLAAGESIAWLKPKLELMQETGVTATPPRIVIEAADRLLGWLISRRMESA
jgi:DNA primase